MQFLKSVALAIIFIISYSGSFSQKTGASKSKCNWYIKEVFNLNETQALGIVEFSFLRQNVVLINNLTKVEWETRIDEYIWGLSKFKGNILVFYKKFGELHMATLDIKSGKILDDKIINNGSKHHHLVVVQNDPAGNFDNLLVRTATFGQPETKAIRLITLSEEGKAIAKDLPSVAINGSYIGCSVANGGHISVASIVNNSVVVEQFNHEAVLENKLEKPLNCRKKFDYNAQMRTDGFASNTVVISLKYENPDKDNVFSYFSFNFNNKQVVVADEAPLNKTSQYKFKNKDYLTPVDILFTNDKIIMVKEVNYLIKNQSGAPTYYFSEAAIVSVYDKQMHLLHDILLDKKTGGYSSGAIGLGFNINNDKLYVLSGEYPSTGTNGDYSYKIDLSTGKWEKKKIGSGKPSTYKPLFTHSTFWFRNECVINHVTFTFGDYDTMFEKINYGDL